MIGHRGAPVLAPENTLESFEAAVAAGADAIELDVGEGLMITHSAAELPERPLSLDAAFDFVHGSGAGVLIDLKAPGVEEEVAAAVHRHGLLERSFVSTTSAGALRRLAGFEPALTRSISYPNDRYRVSRFSWPRSVTTGAATAARAAMPARIPLLLQAARATSLTLHHALVSKAAIRAAHTRGAALVAWTVNDPLAVERLARLGVDGIVTDDPGMALDVLATLNPL